MARMGHSSSRAAMIYLHSTDERQRTIADAVDKTALPTCARPGRTASGIPAGTHLARNWHATATKPRKDHPERLDMPSDLGPRGARLAGLEPATGCLEDRRHALPDLARCRSEPTRRARERP
jgi:hypothetical protein